MAHPCVLKADAARVRLAKLGITQTVLAARCGVELRTLQRWFAGGRVSLEDAERLAAELGLGTAELFEGVPEHASSPFARMRTALHVLRLREGTLAHAFHTTLENFGFVDALVSFAAHPARGFVHRLPIAAADHHGFARLRVRPAAASPIRIRFGGQVGRRFRYEFGEIRVEDGRALATEHFHTRSSSAPLAADGSFDVFVWIAREVRELVVVADQEFGLVPDRTERGELRQLFDLRDEATRHAVCFRPSAMQLNDAGLPSVFDRVEGSRDHRIDVAVHHPR